MKKRELTKDLYEETASQPGMRSKLDGVWIGACTTTHIYCRTVCPAVGHVNRENVVVFLSPAAAEAAGYRPCLTCCPEDMPTPSTDGGFSEQAVAWAQAVSESIAASDTLEATCEKLGITAAAADELTQAQFGAMAAQYVTTARRLSAKKMLREGNPTLSDVALATGYASGAALAADFKTAYKLDAQKLANQRPKKPRLGHFA